MWAYTGDDVRRWLAGVGSIAAAVNAATPLPDLLDLIARTACGLTGYDASGVPLLDDAGQVLRISRILVALGGLRPGRERAAHDHPHVRTAVGRTVEPGLPGRRRRCRSRTSSPTRRSRLGPSLRVITATGRSRPSR